MASFAAFLAFMTALMLLMATRVPVAVALGSIGIVGTAVFVSGKALPQIANIAFTQSSSFVLTVVPLFVLMGEALAATGIGNDLFRAAHMWLRRLPGALAVATVFACAVFAAVCGSSPVTAATIGSLAVPEMMKRGYDKSLALGTAAAGGTLGILIPPSVPMIIYGVLTETSIGDLFIAGIVPGLVLAAAFCVMIMLMAWFVPHKVQDLSGALVQAKASADLSVMQALISLVPMIGLVLLVMGGIYAGWFTPTESGAIGALGALLLALARRRLTLATTWRVLIETGYVTVSILFLIISANIYSRLLALSGMPQALDAWSPARTLVFTTY